LDLDLIQISFLAVLQGFTEFLPISSSGHLILPSLLLGWEDQGLTFDVAVHLGTLLAVISYFLADIRRLLKAWLLSLAGNVQSEDGRLAWLLIIATVPGGLAGLLFGDLVENHARSLPVVAATSLLFAFLMLVADRSVADRTVLQELNWRQALFIGCAQALALIPGTSRSGVTMTAALFCKLSREAAARFSFLMSVPIILATGLLKTRELIAGGSQVFEWTVLVYAMLVSALVAFACIHFFLRLIERIGFMPFVIYRILLGVLLLTIYFAS